MVRHKVQELDGPMSDDVVPMPDPSLCRLAEGGCGFLVGTPW